MFKKVYKEDISLHSGIPKCFSHLKNKQFNDWEIPPWEIYIDSNNKVGEGSWATVYLAEWRHTTVVAKVLKNSFDKHAKQLIIKELDNMTKMHHPNIVQLFGYVEEPFMIIMEYFQNGDLYHNLNKLKINKKIQIATDIIKGLIYIHERRPNSLIHRDIKLRNILLTNSYTAKIADFGLSTFSMKKFIKIASNNNLPELENFTEHELLHEKVLIVDNNKNNNNFKYNIPINEDCYAKEIIEEILIDESNHSKNSKDINDSNELTTCVGTVRYMAPEIHTGKYNNLVDVYSCGILLYELFTSNIYNGEFYWGMNLPKKLIALIYKMTDSNPENRISANIVLEEFQSINFNNNIMNNLKDIFTKK